MSKVFDVLRNLPPIPEKKHTVKVQGKIIEVTLEKKLEVLKHGEEKYMLNKGALALKPVVKAKIRFAKLVKGGKGHNFVDGNPFWIDGDTEEGYTWQTDTE